jgi:FkbM family methyltransferase
MKPSVPTLQRPDSTVQGFNRGTTLTPVPLLLRRLQELDFPHKLGICDRIFGNRLAKHGICWIRTAAGIAWKLDLRNATHRWIVYGKYEGRGFHRWVKGFLRRDALVVDSGANIGQMTLYLAQLIPKGKLLAFEPGREQASWLTECLLAHDNFPVEVIRVALGATTARLYLRDGAPRFFHGSMSQISEAEGEPINVTRLCDALTDRSIEEVDLWKLDVEGHELPALEGAVSLLHEKRVKALYIEMAGENGRHVREYLRGVGYNCYLINNRGRLISPTCFPPHTNGLFLPAKAQ